MRASAMPTSTWIGRQRITSSPTPTRSTRCSSEFGVNTDGYATAVRAVLHRAMAALPHALSQCAVGPHPGDDGEQFVDLSSAGRPRNHGQPAASVLASAIRTRCSMQPACGSLGSLHAGQGQSGDAGKLSEKRSVTCSAFLRKSRAAGEQLTPLSSRFGDRAQRSSLE